MSYEILAFLVGLGVVLYVKFWKVNLSKLTIPDGLKKILTSSVSADSTSGKKPTDDSSDGKRLFWYVVLVMISAIVAKFIGYAPAGIIALIGVHIVWLVYRNKSGWLMPMVIYGMLAFFILAWLLPPIIQLKDSGLSLAETATRKTSVSVTKIAKDYRDGSVTQTYSWAMDPIVALKEEPSKWIVLPPNKNIAYTCRGNGVFYIRHSLTGPEGLGPYPCTPNGVSIDHGALNNGHRLLNVSVQFQSTDEPFVVDFQECPNDNSCIIRAS